MEDLPDGLLDRRFRATGTAARNRIQVRADPQTNSRAEPKPALADRLLTWGVQTQIAIVKLSLLAKLWAVKGVFRLFRSRRTAEPVATPETEMLEAQKRLHRFVLRVLFTKLMAGLAVLAASLTYTNPYAPPGHEGYVYERPRILGAGGFKGVIAGPANFGISLWRNEIVTIDTRPTTYTEDFTVLTRDDLNIRFKFHAVIALRPGSIQTIVEDLGGENWYARYVREPFRSYVRDALQKHKSTDIKSLMGEIARDVKGNLDAYVAGTPFRLVSLDAGDIDYPEVVAQAVQKKLSAQQLLEEKEILMLIARKDAEIKVVEANGSAEAQRIVSSTLTQNYLQHEAIQAQMKLAESPNKATVYIPVGNNGIPLVRSAE